MRTKSHILDRSEKYLLKGSRDEQIKAERDHLFLEVWIDIRDNLTFIKRALQARNEHLSKQP